MNSYREEYNKLIEQIENLKKGASGRKNKWTYCTPKGNYRCYKEAAQVNDIKPLTLVYRCKKGIYGFSLIENKFDQK